MESSIGETYRVLRRGHDAGEVVLWDDGTQDAIVATTAGYEGDLAETVAAIEPGNRIHASLSWAERPPRFTDVTIETRTTLEFAPAATGIFEAARETWREAEREGRAMNSRVTRSTDGEANGVVYTFAKQSGGRDLYEEFREGITPLEPLVERFGEDAEPPFAVFVVRPTDEPFVLVVLATDRDGLLAGTMRDTYDEL